MSATGESEGRVGAGFTLIEMLVTLAVAGLASGVVFPAIERMMARQAFDRQVAATVLALREARADAMRQSMRTAFDSRAVQGAQTAVKVDLDAEVPAFLPDGSAVGGGLTIRGGRYAARIVVDPVTGTPGVVR